MATDPLPTDDTPTFPEAVNLDALHLAVTEAAMDLGRGYADRHPYATRYHRPALAHEQCIPGEACNPALGVVVVTFLAPGIRARWAA